MLTRSGFAVLAVMLLFNAQAAAKTVVQIGQGGEAAAAKDDSAYTDNGADSNGGDHGSDSSDSAGVTQKIKLFNDAAGTLYLDGDEIGKIQSNVDEPYVIRAVSAGQHRLKLVTEDKTITHVVVIHAGHNKIVHINAEDAGDEGDAVQGGQGRHNSGSSEYHPPARSYEGAKTACSILNWSGFIVGCVGIYYGGKGTKDTQAGANAAYLTSPGIASDGNFYGYDINGHYVTYDAYEQYLQGQAEIDDAYICWGVMGTCWLVSICIPTHAPGQTSLIDIHDKQVAFAVPLINVDPRSGKMDATLLTAKF